MRHDAHRPRPGIEAYEDGTPNFLGIAALPDSFDFIEAIGIDAIARHVHRLTADLIEQLRQRRHANGTPVFLTYGPVDLRGRGGTVAFNVLNASGRVVACEHVEAQAVKHGVAVRGGCFCNPGAAEAAFNFPANETLRCLRTMADEEFSSRKLAECLGGGDVAVGAVRASVGLGNTMSDITRGVDALAAVVGA